MFEFNATFLIAMFSFVVFIFIMNTIFYKPILNIIKKREDYICTNYEDAKDIETATQNLKNIHEEKLNLSKETCRQQFKKEICEAQNISTSNIQNKKEEAKEKIQTQKEALLIEEKQVVNKLNENVIFDLASAITSKILDK